MSTTRIILKKSEKQTFVRTIIQLKVYFLKVQL